MSEQKTIFVSTAIPYVNAKPHIGFALELVQADVIANYYRHKGFSVFFLTGTDENSLKNVKAAKEQKITTQDLCEFNSAAFKDLSRLLEISNDYFIRTSAEEKHRQAAQKLWRITKEKYIFKKHYSGLYCVGCEDFYTENELVDNKCPEHKTELELVSEENYFFKLTPFQEALYKMISSKKLSIVPEKRANEILSFIKGGLKDFSISRSTSRAENWGIKVPEDDSQVMYVWYDALTNYISALNFGDEDSINNRSSLFNSNWTNADKIIHVIGKGINRFHSIYWPAMLLGAKLRTPDTVFVHGYLTVNGEKISKSLDNTIDPVTIIKKYGSTALRYYLLRSFSPFEDGDFREEKLVETYNSDLANNIGNLVKRFETMGERINYKIDYSNQFSFPSEFEELMNDFRFNDAINYMLGLSSELNREFELNKPWIALKNGNNEKVQIFLDSVLERYFITLKMLGVFIPSINDITRIRYSNQEYLKISESLFPKIV